MVHTLARDGLCMIVNKDNPVTALSDQQIAGIFKGEPAELIKSFVDFASSAAAAPIVKERRFAPKKS